MMLLKLLALTETYAHHLHYTAVEVGSKEGRVYAEKVQTHI